MIRSGRYRVGRDWLLIERGVAALRQRRQAAIERPDTCVTEPDCYDASRE